MTDPSSFPNRWLILLGLFAVVMPAALLLVFALWSLFMGIFQISPRSSRGPPNWWPMLLTGRSA